MASARIIRVDTDMVVEVANLRNQTTNALLSAATVTAELLTLADASVAGATNPFTLAAVSGTEGTYRGTLSNAFATVAGTSYKLKIVANAGAGLLRTQVIIVEAQE